LNDPTTIRPDQAGPGCHATRSATALFL